MKHALGLMNGYGSGEVRLVYLYWEPQNAESWPECRRHRAEADDLAARVSAFNRPTGSHELPRVVGRVGTSRTPTPPAVSQNPLRSRSVTDRVRQNQVTPEHRIDQPVVGAGPLEGIAKLLRVQFQ